MRGPRRRGACSAACGIAAQVVDGTQVVRVAGCKDAVDLCSKSFDRRVAGVEQQVSCVVADVAQGGDDRVEAGPVARLQHERDVVVGRELAQVALDDGLPAVVERQQEARSA